MQIRFRLATLALLVAGVSAAGAQPVPTTPAPASLPSLYTPNPTGLIGEYLFEPTVGSVVRNTISPGTLDGTIVDSPQHPLVGSTDVPFGRPGRASLDYDVLRTLKTTGAAPQTAFAQYVEVPAFPDLPEMTVSMWVKVDYVTSDVAFEDPPPGTYPDGQVGFGACPQPACKANSWYLFLSTLQTDRNLIFTIIPDNVTQGLPKSATDTSGSGGVVHDDLVSAGRWTHVAATFQNLGPGENLMLTYIDGVFKVREWVEDFAGQLHHIPSVTDQVIAPSPGQPLRLGQFRAVQSNLDYQYSGRMAGVRIYDRALTPAEIIEDIRADLGTLRVVCGDCNLDQQIDSLDAQAILDHAVGNVVITGPRRAACDVNRDGTLNVSDAVIVLNLEQGTVPASYRGCPTCGDCSGSPDPPFTPDGAVDGNDLDAILWEAFLAPGSLTNSGHAACDLDGDTVIELDDYFALSDSRHFVTGGPMPVCGLCGDCDLNGIVEQADGELALDAAVGLVAFNDLQFGLCDVNKTRSIDVGDVVAILNGAPATCLARP